MAVPEQTPFIEYTANGTTTVFPVPFQCDKAEYLIVLVDDVEPVVGAWSLSNGAVVFNTAPENGKKITIQRNTPFSRTADYQSYNNSFRPPAVNKDFDLIWWKLQELGVADWILSNRIDALKNYVDDRDDELRAYLLEEIRKQGVALDQLEDYYNYLMQRLAQIAVDKGWDASFVVDGDKSQHEINEEQASKNVQLTELIASSVEVEEQRALLAESTLQTNINTENTRATGAESTLNTKIDNETSRAIGVEQSLQLQITTGNAGIKYFSTEAELLAFVPTASDPKQAYAFDTKKNYLWVLKSGSTTKYEWRDEGKSVLNLAEDYTDSKVNPLAKIVSSNLDAPLEEAKDASNMPFRITKANGDIISTAKSLQYFDFNILTDDKNNIFLLVDKLTGAILRIDNSADFHIPADLKFDNGKSLIDSVSNIDLSSEKLFKKHAGLTYQQALVNRLPERSEFTSVMTLAESNGLINRMMSGIKTPTGLFLVWHQKTKPEYDGDSSGSALWRGFADIDSNYNITVRDKSMFMYPDTDAGIVKHPHLGRTSDNRIILIYEKSIGKVEGPINYTRYVRYSSDEGVTWTDPVALTYTNAPPTTALKALGTTGNILSLSSGRLIVPLYSIIGHCGCIYSDNDGNSWTYSDKFILESNWGLEPSIAFDSNDDLIMSMRPLSNNPMFAAFAKSVDNGMTWELMHKDRVVSVTSQSHLSYDKNLGVHFESHDISPLNRRTHYRISLSYDDGYTFPLSYAPFADDRYVGYTQIIKWADGVYLLLMEYNDTWISTNQNEEVAIQLFTISEIINNVTSS